MGAVIRTLDGNVLADSTPLSIFRVSGALDLDHSGDFSSGGRITLDHWHHTIALRTLRRHEGQAS